MAYCTADDVKKYSQITYNQLGFTDDTTFQAYLTNTLIPRAQKLMDEYCGRDFTEHASQTEYLDGNAKLIIYPAHSPIISVTSLSKNSDYFGKGSWTVQSTDDYQIYDDYIVDENGFDEGYKNWKLVYTYGYATVPTTVTEVCARAVANMLHFEIMNKLGTIITATGPFGEYKVAIPDRIVLTDELKRELDAYRITRFESIS